MFCICLFQLLTAMPFDVGSNEAGRNNFIGPLTNTFSFRPILLQSLIIDTHINQGSRHSIIFDIASCSHPMLYSHRRNPNNLYRQQDKRPQASLKIILFLAATTFYTAFLYSTGTNECPSSSEIKLTATPVHPHSINAYLYLEAHK